MNGWDFAWIAWLLAFLAIELPAALNKTPGDTLSEHVWAWIGTDSSRKATFAAFFAALTSHFLTQSTVAPVCTGGAAIGYAIFTYYSHKEEGKMSKVWSWFSGKKTVIGAVLLLADVAVPFAPLKYVAAATTIIGLAHKAYKKYYGTDPQS